MPCQADPARPRYRAPGWTCDGTGLVTVLRGPKNIPVVVPTRLLPEVMARIDAAMFSPEPFPGGDHFHLCIEGGPDGSTRTQAEADEPAHPAR